MDHVCFCLIVLMFSYEVLRMYDVENCSAVLENATGFARLDVYIYIWSCNKMAAFGYVYTLGI